MGSGGSDGRTQRQPALGGDDDGVGAGQGSPAGDRARIREEPPATEWALILGVILTNLRAVLDHAIYVATQNPD